MGLRREGGLQDPPDILVVGDRSQGALRGKGVSYQGTLAAGHQDSPVEGLLILGVFPGSLGARRRSLGVAQGAWWAPLGFRYCLELPCSCWT